MFTKLIQGISIICMGMLAISVAPFLIQGIFFVTIFAFSVAACLGVLAIIGSVITKLWGKQP